MKGSHSTDYNTKYVVLGTKRAPLLLGNIALNPVLRITPLQGGGLTDIVTLTNRSCHIALTGLETLDPGA